MNLDYELVISCALAAAVILRIAHHFREWRKLRRRLKTLRTRTAELQAMDLMRRDADQNPSRRTVEQPAGVQVDRIILYLLIVAILWFGGRIWLQHYAAAEAIDMYESSVARGAMEDSCRYATEAAQSFHASKDQNGYLKWLAI